MKEIYLLCNAHIDPVWQWPREEGIAETISTFRVAAEFCEKYEGFVFNHNESVLYEWVEEHEPDLFVRIQKLVREGKWRIMGGWYIQPDCVMPDGESFLRQIDTGNRYFMKKFGVKPTTAINFDPFGHTRGLVQILKKCGYDSYLFMRPFDFAPEQNFIWRGYDGSEVIGHNMIEGYRTPKGEAVDKVRKLVEDAGDNDKVLVLWGIGNHGGGPSRVDLEAINAYIREHPEISIKHSWCEDYFARIDTAKLRTVPESIVHCMVGCYTSMVRLKQKHRFLESQLSLCEKMLAFSGVDYDKRELEEAEKALMFTEFHDILPGSSIKRAEEDALRLLDYGSEITNRYCLKAFFRLCDGQKPGRDGEIPVLVYNPHPYAVTQEVEVEFMLEDVIWEPQVTLARVRDAQGRCLPTQNEKEDSMMKADWRKRICFRAELKPMSMNRFDCELTTIPGGKREVKPALEDATHFKFINDRMEVFIHKKTGLIDRWCVDGKERILGSGGRILVYRDNEDPWGMLHDGFFDCIGEFEPLSGKEANTFNGYPEEAYENVRLIENGEVRARVQVIKRFGNSFAVVTYTIPKLDTYVDVHVKMLSNDYNRLYKLSFDTVYDGEFQGQTAFGREEHMLKEEKEVTYQKWCALTRGEEGFAVLNRGTYGGSAKGGTLNITLLRTPVYAAHPASDPQIADTDRCLDHIDIGEREFEYRLTCDMARVDALAERYNQQVYALSFFPSGQGEKIDTSVTLDNEEILMTGYKIAEDGRLIRLFNAQRGARRTVLCMGEAEFPIDFGPYEVKTYFFDGSSLEERDMLGREW